MGYLTEQRQGEDLLSVLQRCTDKESGLVSAKADFPPCVCGIVVVQAQVCVRVSVFTVKHFMVDLIRFLPYFHKTFRYLGCKTVLCHVRGTEDEVCVTRY